MLALRNTNIRALVRLFWTTLSDSQRLSQQTARCSLAWIFASRIPARTFFLRHFSSASFVPSVVRLYRISSVLGPFGIRGRGSRLLHMSNFQQLLSCPFRAVNSLSDSSCDGVIVVAHSADQLNDHNALRPLFSAVNDYLKINEGAKEGASLIVVDKSIIPSGRLVYSSTGPVCRDQDDVRRFFTAASKAMKLAISAGMRNPVLATMPHKRYSKAELVAALGAIQQLYVPLNVREEENKPKLDSLHFMGVGHDSKKLLRVVEAFEASFTVCRDIGDSDPERMAPPRVAEYVQKIFKGTNVRVHVTDNQEEIAREYPLMAAVNRAANQVEAHKARLIWLEYIPDGNIDETLMLVGKGVTIDTGGTDLKVGGHMFGMSRDKYGSAIVAAFFKALDIFRPKGIKVVGYMCMVRNSIGSHSYTCDEIIRARSGKRIHIYNTDAEGRITMLDPLTRMRELAVHEVNPHLFTMATLTGHAILTAGYYSVVMDNGPAKAAHNAERLQKYGDEYGQPTEFSRLYAEDYAFHAAESEHADLRQGNTLPSVQTLRGHQTPAAFLIQASRLDEHGCDSKTPIKFSHVDMGSAMGEYPEMSYPNPLVAFVAAFVLPRSS